MPVKFFFNKIYDNIRELLVIKPIYPAAVTPETFSIPKFHNDNPKAMDPAPHYIISNHSEADTAAIFKSGN